MSYNPRVVLLSSALAVTVILIGCGGGANPREPLAVSCATIDALASYRYTINVKLNVARGTPSPTNPQPSANIFTDSLNALLSDFTIDGAYIAPDHTTAILRFQKDEVELRAIGNQSWERLDNTWRRRDEPVDDIFLLTPDIVCNDTVRGLAPSFAGVKPQKETLQGIETRRYHLDKADIVLPAGAPSTIPETYQVDLWLAKEGLWPVQLEISAAATAERFSMRFQDINDPGIRIDEPTIASPQ